MVAMLPRFVVTPSQRLPGWHAVVREFDGLRQVVEAFADEGTARDVSEHLAEEARFIEAVRILGDERMTRLAIDTFDSARPKRGGR